MNRSIKNLLNKLQNDVRKLKRGMKMDKNFYKVQYGILLSKVSELEKENIKLKEDFRRLHRLYTFGTPTDGLEVGNPEDYEPTNQLNLFDNNDKNN